MIEYDPYEHVRELESKLKELKEDHKQLNVYYKSIANILII